MMIVKGSAFYSLIIGIAFASSAHASSKLVYMVEFLNAAKQDEKQIVLASEDGTDQENLTSGKRFHLYPRLSADGTEVAFVDGVDGDHLAIVTMNLKTRALEQWTPEVGQNLHPRFSGDGKWLAFSGFPKGSKIPQIGIINIEEARKNSSSRQVMVDGKSRTLYEVSPQFIASPYPSYFPALSSDGSFVIFQRDKGKDNRDIVLLSLEEPAPPAGPPAQISEASGKSMAPSLSFDDRQVAFTSFVDGNWDIFIFDRLKNKTTRVTADLAMDFAPSFSPQGDLVFASNRVSLKKSSGAGPVEAASFQLYKIKASDLVNVTAEKAEKLETLVSAVAGDLYAPSLSGKIEVAQHPMTPMIAPERSSFGSVKLGDRIYVAGGHQGVQHTYPPESFTNRVEYFDLKNKTWNSVAPRNYPCHGFGLAAAPSRYVYAFGGFGYAAKNNPQWESLDVIERYDEVKNKWEVIGHMPHKRSSNVVAQVGSKVYLIGGWDSTPRFEKDYEGTFLDSVDFFDLETEKMETTSYVLPNPLRRALSGVVSGEKVILIGGISQGADHFTLIDNVTALDTKTGTWEEWPSLPFGTFAPAAAVINKSVYVFGGMLQNGQDALYVNHIFTLDPEHRAWNHSGRYLSEAKAFSQVVEMKPGLVAIMGGHVGTADNHPVTTCETFEVQK